MSIFGKTDYRKIPKENRAAFRLVDELLGDRNHSILTSKKKRVTKAEKKRLAAEEKAKEVRQKAYEEEKRRKKEEEKRAEEQRQKEELERIAREKEELRKKLEKEKADYQKLIDSGVRSNHFDKRFEWDDELRLKLLNDEDCLEIATILIAFNSLALNVSEDKKNIAELTLKAGSMLEDILEKIPLNERSKIIEKLNNVYPHDLCFAGLKPHEINLQKKVNSLVLCRDVAENFSKDECEAIMMFQAIVATLDKFYLLTSVTDGVNEEEHKNLYASELALRLDQGFYRECIKEITDSYSKIVKDYNRDYFFKRKTIFLPNIIWIVIYITITFMSLFGPIPWWISIFSFSAVVVMTPSGSDGPPVGFFEQLGK